MSTTSPRWPLPGPGNLAARTRAIRRGVVLAGLLALAVAVLGASGRKSGELPGVESRPGLTYQVTFKGWSRVDLYLPDAPPPEGGWPVVVAIHGGAWLGGDRRDYGRRLAPLARRGVAVASIDYRLSRSDRPSWPGNLEDVRAAVRWLRRNATFLKVDPTRIAALGSSAGGHLAALLGTLGDDDPDSRVDAVVVFYGPSDLESLHRKLGPDGPVARMLGGTPESTPDRYRAASPVDHVSADDPPMFLIHGDLDPTVPLDQSRRLDEALEHAGVRHRLRVVEGAGHGFGLEVSGQNLTTEILEFLERSWDDSPQSRSVGVPAPGIPPTRPGGPLLHDETNPDLK